MTNQKQTDFFNDFQKFQQECPEIPLNKTAKISAKFSYKYADLASIMKIVKPLLKKHNFIVFWATSQSDDGEKITCTVVHSTGITHTSSLKLRSAEDPKTRGADITYYRRYMLTALLGLITEEDKDAPPEKSEKPKDKDKPKLNESQFQKIVDRINGGERGLLATTSLHFNITDSQANTLRELELLHK